MSDVVDMYQLSCLSSSVGRAQVKDGGLSPTLLVSLKDFFSDELCCVCVNINVFTKPARLGTCTGMYYTCIFDMYTVHEHRHGHTSGSRALGQSISLH